MNNALNLHDDKLTTKDQKTRIMHGLPDKLRKLYINSAYTIMSEAENDCERTMYDRNKLAMGGLGEIFILMEQLTQDFDDCGLDTIDDILFSDKYVERLEELASKHEYIKLDQDILNSLRLLERHSSEFTKSNMEFYQDARAVSGKYVKQAIKAERQRQNAHKTNTKLNNNRNLTKEA